MILLDYAAHIMITTIVLYMMLVDYAAHIMITTMVLYMMLVDYAARIMITTIRSLHDVSGLCCSYYDQKHNFSTNSLWIFSI